MPELHLNKHPAEFFLRYELVKDPSATDAMLAKTLDDWGMLQPSATYWGFLRQRIQEGRPQFLNPANRFDQHSMKYLRDQKIYDLFYPSAAVEEAWTILADPTKRSVVEQLLMATNVDLRLALQRLNKKNNWFLSLDALRTYYHFFWHVKLMTFDEWGRFLYERSSMYDRHMVLLQASMPLALFHLRIEQSIESKKMIQRVQEIAYHTLEEVNLRPTNIDKSKNISLLGKVIVECHNALSTSDMALKDVLSQFERFRMETPQKAPPSIHDMAPNGNFSGSGATQAPAEKEKLN